MSAFAAISTELLANGCGVRFRAEGGSMHPTIRSGELITVVPIALPSIRRGDILLVENQTRIVAHRVIAIDAGEEELPRFTLQGDGMDRPDTPIGPTAVLGLVRAVERGGREVRLARWRPVALRFFDRVERRLTTLLRTSLDAR